MIIASEKQRVRNFNRPDGRERAAGFAPKSDERIAKSEKRERRIHSERLRKAMQKPVSGPYLRVTNGRDFTPILPEDFVAESIAKLQIHVGRGHWAQAKECIDGIAEQWELLRIERNPSSATLAEKLAWHVGQVFKPRMANLIETVCSATIGSLLECFPSSFVGMNAYLCGPDTVRHIAERLLQIGVIDEKERRKRLDEYQQLIDAME